MLTYGGLALLLLLTIALHRYLHAGTTVGEGDTIDIVLSFGARAGGFEYAKELKAAIVKGADWDATHVYLDRDRLVSERAFTGREGGLYSQRPNTKQRSLYQNTRVPCIRNANPRV